MIGKVDYRRKALAEEHHYLMDRLGKLDKADGFRRGETLKRIEYVEEMYFRLYRVRLA